MLANLPLNLVAIELPSARITLRITGKPHEFLRRFLALAPGYIFQKPADEFLNGRAIALGVARSQA